MAFLGMFKSRQARDTELKTRVRKASMRIQKFVRQKRTQAESFKQLARQAWDLDDQEQFRTLSADYLQCRDAITRWERYLVKLKALELRKGEGEATREFLDSMNALTSSILRGVRPEDVMMLQTDMDAAITHSEELEEALAIAMDDAVVRSESPELLDPELLTTAVGVSAAPNQVEKRQEDVDFERALNHSNDID